MMLRFWTCIGHPDLSVENVLLHPMGEAALHEGHGLDGTSSAKGDTTGNPEGDETVLEERAGWTRQE